MKQGERELQVQPDETLGGDWEVHISRIDTTLTDDTKDLLTTCSEVVHHKEGIAAQLVEYCQVSGELHRRLQKSCQSLVLPNFDSDLPPVS